MGDKSNLTKIEALDIARDVLEGYLNGNGSSDDSPNFKEAYEVLTIMRNNIQKQNLKTQKRNKLRR